MVTYEMEHVEISEGLARARRHDAARPSLRVLATAQDRALEKAHLAANALPHASFEVARGKAEAARVAAQFPLPFIVKTARGGYDGKGQSFVKDADGARALTFDDDTVYVFEEALTWSWR
ncbi:MAG: ATP-grasp domain-containing protein [Myxococcales bacterium]|nr:ATP-grasp domain-containing protein [Myxococcales bacterium]